VLQLHPALQTFQNRTGRDSKAGVIRSPDAGSVKTAHGHKETSMNRNLQKFALRSSVAIALALSGAAAFAATATGTATATVITPIQITNSKPLQFGRFAPGTGGTLTVSTAGAPTFSGILRPSTSGTTSAAVFDVAGDANATYAITYTPSGTTLTKGGDSMDITYTVAVGTATGAPGAAEVSTGTLDNSGVQTIAVGGTLTVSANQPVGDYTGSINVAVEYN
jgi:hypothetical protein